MEKSIGVIAVIVAFTCGIILGFVFGYGANVKTIKEIHMAADTQFFLERYIDQLGEQITRECNEKR
jgi:hypothetical protein